MADNHEDDKEPHVLKEEVQPYYYESINHENEETVRETVHFWNLFVMYYNNRYNVKLASYVNIMCQQQW